MTRETLKQYIDQIIIKHYGFEQDFFTTKPNNGENIILKKNILCNPLDAYTVLSEIEHKCGILVNDDIIFNSDITYEQFINIFWDEYKREKEVK